MHSMNNRLNRLILFILNIYVFLNLSQFLNTIGIIHVPGYIYIFIFFIVSLYIYYMETIKYQIPRLFLNWSLYYIFIATFSLLFISDFNDITWKVYYMLLFNIFTMYVYYVLFLLDNNNFTFTLNLMPYIAMSSAFLTISSYIWPDIFIPLKIYILNNDHRAVGTYINSNVTGNALNFLLIISINNVKKNYRIFFILLLGIAIVVTFSRSNILMYLLIVAVFPFFKVVRFSELIVVFGIFFFLLGLFILNVDLLRESLGINISTDQIQRLMFFTDNKGSASISDGSATHRIEVAKKALEYFMNNSVMGAGIGVTRIWSDSISTHNTYLSLLAEYGFFGLVVLLFLLFAVTKNLIFSIDKSKKQLGVLFVIYILFTSLFTHNTLDSSIKLGMFALILAISTKEQRKIYD